MNEDERLRNENARMRKALELFADERMWSRWCWDPEDKSLRGVHPQDIASDALAPREEEA